MVLWNQDVFHCSDSCVLIDFVASLSSHRSFTSQEPLDSGRVLLFFSSLFTSSTFTGTKIKRYIRHRLSSHSTQSMEEVERQVGSVTISPRGC